MDVSTPGLSPHAPASAPAFPRSDSVFSFPPSNLLKFPAGVVSPIPLQPPAKRGPASDRYVTYYNLNCAV